MTYRINTFYSWSPPRWPCSCHSVVADVPDKLPKPDGKPADQSKAVKVFIMMGQSNMLGFGRVGPAETKGHAMAELLKK